MAYIHIYIYIYIFTEYCIIHTSMLALPTENELFENLLITKLIVLF